MTNLTNDELGQIIQLIRNRKGQKIRSDSLLPLLNSIERKLIEQMSRDISLRMIQGRELNRDWSDLERFPG